jgi:hypothetical protein
MNLPRIGHVGYCSMLACIKQPADMRTIRAKIGAHPTTIHAAMAYCVRQGVAHVVGWHRPAPKSQAVPTWRLGPGQSVPNPDGRPTTRARPASSLEQIVAILQATQDEPLTRPEIAEDIGYSLYTVERAILRLRAAGLVHIAAWDRPVGPGTTVARFSAGPGVDRPRPRSVPNWREHQRRHRERKRMATMLGLIREAA